MAFNRGVGFWIVVAVVVINVAGGIYASLTDEPMHAFVHGALAVGFGLWARYLRTARVREVERPARVEMLEDDVSELQRQLMETQERLDFADQLLKQRPKSS
jgi:acyl-coenzyme A thioesterase PaaI-like protein